ncbi:MAG: GIDE domain-containing protein, partial [Halobacteria archaeon]|nr:GIDE domain-containing protein [Halobacteria archaeon]
MVFPTLFSMGALFIGILALYGAVHKHRQKRLVTDTPTSKVRSLAMGPVEFKGKAEKHEETLTSPFSDEECVAYTYGIEEYTKYHTDDGTEYKWKSVEAGKRAVPFFVNDGTGRVLVDPDGAEMEMTKKNEYEVDEGDETPANVREFMERRGDEFENQRGMGITSMAEMATSTDLRMGDADPSGRRKFI